MTRPHATIPALLAALAFTLAGCSKEADDAGRPRSNCGRRSGHPGRRADADPAAAGTQGAQLHRDRSRQRARARGPRSRFAPGARQPDQADDRLRRVPRAQGRPHQARRHGHDQRARLEAGRLEDVRPGRHAGVGREPGAGHDRPVRQRRDRRAGRARRRHGADVRADDEHLREGARHDGLELHQHAPACPIPSTTRRPATPRSSRAR